MVPRAPALSWEKEKAFLDGASERSPGESSLVAVLGKRLGLVVQSHGRVVRVDWPGKMQPWESLHYPAKG